MENQLSNTVTSVGNYNNIPTSVTSVASVVTMVSGLTLEKTADKPVWADGELTYTITLKNEAASNYESPVITDVIDTTLVEFVDGSVIIDGSAATSDQYNYNSGNNTLTINLTDVGASSTKVISFKVRKKS